MKNWTQNSNGLITAKPLPIGNYCIMVQINTFTSKFWSKTNTDITYTLPTPRSYHCIEAFSIVNTPPQLFVR